MLHCKGVATSVGISAVKLVSKHITGRIDGQNYENTPRAVKKMGFSFQASHGRESALPENTHLRFDLCWVILFILYMPCFERCTDKKKKKTRHGTSQNALRTCTSSWLCSHPLVYSMSFSFLSGLLSPARSDSNLNLYRYLSLPFTSENATPSLPYFIPLLHLPLFKNDTIIINNLFPYFLLFFAFLQANQTILQCLPIRISPFSPLIVVKGGFMYLKPSTR